MLPCRWRSDLVKEHGDCCLASLEVTSIMAKIGGADPKKIKTRGGRAQLFPFPPGGSGGGGGEEDNKEGLVGER